MFVLAWANHRRDGFEWRVDVPDEVEGQRRSRFGPSQTGLSNWHGLLGVNCICHQQANNRLFLSVGGDLHCHWAIWRNRWKSSSDFPRTFLSGEREMSASRHSVLWRAAHVAFLQRRGKITRHSLPNLTSLHLFGLRVVLLSICLSVRVFARPSFYPPIYSIPVDKRDKTFVGHS